MNEKIFYLLNSLSGQSIFFDKVIVFLSNQFGYLLIVASLLFIIFNLDKEFRSKNKIQIIRQKIKELIFVYGSTLTVWGLVFLLKNLFYNPRPFLVYQDIHTLFYYGGEESFPSGHAAFYGALAVSIFAYHRRAGILFATGAFILGISRVIAGVHFPEDILVGFIFGASISVLVYALIKVLSKKYKKYIDFFFNSV